MEEKYNSQDPNEPSVEFVVSDQSEHSDSLPILIEFKVMEYDAFDLFLSKEEFRGILKAMLRFDERL